MTWLTIIRNEDLTEAEMMEAIYAEAVTNAHAYVFCNRLDEGMDPGEAADTADRAVLEL